MLAKSHIYTLLDPRDNAVRYVGQSVEPRARYKAHLAESSKGSEYRCHRWIRALASAGYQPIMLVIEEVDGEFADEAEMRWIAHYRSVCADLTNHTAGGRGFRGHKPTKEAIEKRAAALRGRPRSDAVRQAIKEGLNRPETRHRLSISRLGNKSRTGQKQTDEEKKRRANANRGKRRLPEFCEAMRQKALGVRHSEETKQKMSKSKLTMISPERRSEIAKIANLAMQEKRKCRSRAE